jgi:hypothetical protein
MVPVLDKRSAASLKYSVTISFHFHNYKATESATTFSIMTFSITTFSITTLSITTFSIMDLFTTQHK